MDTKFNNANIEGLLRVAAAKLNMKPEVLRKQLEEGKFSEAIKNMNPKDAARFRQAVKDPSVVKNMMTNDQAKDMYRKITGEDPK